MHASDPAKSVGVALDEYLASNGFDVAAYEAATYEVDLAEVTGEVWTFPNRPSRRRAVPLHDLHHVLTGYGTDVLGEAEIGAWELVAGCTSFFLWWINASAVGLGLLLSPTRVLRAGMRALGQRSLYRQGMDYVSLLQMTVGQLRADVGMPERGQADRPPRLHRRAPAATPAPRSLPGPVRRMLRIVAGGVNPIFGGVRVESMRERHFMTTGNFGLARIGQIAVPVTDIDRAVAFYRDVLGMRFLFQAPPGLGFFDCGGVRLMLDAPAKDQAGQGGVLYYQVPDLQVAFETLSARGVAFEAKPHLIARMPDHELWMAFFRDPDRNLLALMSEVR